jgi:sugar lactone lactonase YvrE
MNTNIEELYKKKYLKYKAKYLNIQRGGVFYNGRNHPKHYAQEEKELRTNSIDVGGISGFMALDNHGNIAVVDKTNKCVKVFDIGTANKLIDGEIKLPDVIYTNLTSVAFAEVTVKGKEKTKLYISYAGYVVSYDYEILDKEKKLKITKQKEWQCPTKYFPINSIAVKDKKLFICGNDAILSLDENEKLEVIIICPPRVEVQRLKNLSSIAFDRFGNLVVADGINKRIQIFDKKNTVIGQFKFPNDFAFDLFGYIYVADLQNNSVLKLNYKTGALISKIEIIAPNGIAIDGNGRILVSTENSIKIFKPDAFTKVEPYTRPPQNAVPPLQKYFVYDGINHPEYTIGKVSLTGDTKFSKLGNETFSEPALMVLDDQGNIVLVDTGNKCVKVINPKNGDVIRIIGNIQAPDGKPGRLNKPMGIAFANANQIIVSDDMSGGSSQLVVFEYSSGKPITSAYWHREYTAYGIAVRDGYVFAPSHSAFYVFNINDNLSFTRKIRNRGTGPGQLGGGNNIVFDKNGNIVLADSDNKRIQIIKPDGTFIKFFNTEGFPNGIIVDSENNIIVTETDTKPSFSCVSVYNQKGKKLKTYGKFGTSIGEFQNPFGIAINTAGNIFVSDKNNNRIIKIY